jgi:hypothetical protein
MKMLRVALRNGFLIQAAAFRGWLEVVQTQQQGHPLHLDPVFTISELQDRFEVVSRKFAKLNRIPAPKPPASKNATVVPSEAAGNSSNATDSSGSSGTNASGTDNVDNKPADLPHDELRR